MLKNYKGKLKGLRNIALIDTKRKEDKALSAFINSKANLKTKYGTLMSDIDGLYNLINQDAYKEMWMNNIYTSTSLMRVAKEINIFKAAMLEQKTTQQQHAFLN